MLRFAVNDAVAAAAAQIECAYKKRGIIILTDPDTAGERIRRRLAKLFPQAKHAFVPQEEAYANNDIGIEQAQPEAIRKALLKVRTLQEGKKPLFFAADLLQNGLSGTAMASAKRAAIGVFLGIGYANAKVFLRRLNHYGVSREEFSDALRQYDMKNDERSPI